jgi:hypothetical protein
MKNIFQFLSIILIPTAFMISCGDEETECAATCQNGGTCVADTCQCPVGFSGNTCGTEIRAVIIGDHLVSDGCASGGGYVMSIAAGSGSGAAITINNLGGYGFTLNATVSEEYAGNIEIDIPTQSVTIGGQSASISGGGVWYRDNDSGFMNYDRIINGQIQNDCAFSF